MSMLTVGCTGRRRLPAHFRVQKIVIGDVTEYQERKRGRGDAEGTVRPRYSEIQRKFHSRT